VASQWKRRPERMMMSKEAKQVVKQETTAKKELNAKEGFNVYLASSSSSAKAERNQISIYRYLLHL